MKISELISRLSKMKDDIGDVDVMILDDESGEYEKVAAAVVFSIKGDTRVDLCTIGQLGDNPSRWW